jgi:outer membrane protein assembly factor BamB
MMATRTDVAAQHAQSPWLAIALFPALCTTAINAAQPGPEMTQQPGVTAEKDPAESLFPGCAALKTDAETHRFLKKAADLVAEGRPDLAAVIWQKVIDESGDGLIVDTIVKPVGPSSTPLIVYRPVREHVEDEMRRMPAALAAYRTLADAEARAILATAANERDERSLREVAGRFFGSSMGDDAAFKLACLALDRQDFVVASRLLRRLLDHTDSSIPTGEILLRLAIAAAYVRDQALAEEALGKLKAAEISRDRAEFVDLVKSDVARILGNSLADPITKSAGWPMALGNASRSGQMPAVWPANVVGPLTELFACEMAVPTAETLQLSGGFRGERPDTSIMSAAARNEILRLWRDAGWRPTGKLLFDGDRVYLKSASRLFCFSADDATQPRWQSAWENRYELDGLSRQMLMVSGAVGQQMPQSALPNTRQTIWAFGDPIAQSMSIADGVIYSLEGRRTTGGSSYPADRNGAIGSKARRTRVNWLTAYHASGGKAIWTRSGGGEDQNGLGEVGFLGAPVPCGSLLLAPITDGGTMWLGALERASGKTLWKTFLCDEPANGASPWAEIVMSVSGREAYLTCGCGVVFAVDGNDGQMRWATRYARAEQKPDLRSMDVEAIRRAGPAGWDDDVTICYGRLLLVMSSDSDHILALDRRTGQRVWEAPRTSPLGKAANYCLGVNRGRIFVAGKNVLRSYDIATGRMVAEQQLNTSLGRGCLTSDELFIPVEEHIERFDLNLTRTNSISVALTAREPIGNLFSDGEKLWLEGPGRVYALTTLDKRLASLAQRIAAGDVTAQFERAQVHQRRGRVDLMVEDARAAYRALSAKVAASEAAQQTLDFMSELRLAQDEPVATLRLLSGIALPQGLAVDKQRRDIVGIAISNIRQRRPAGAPEELLKATSLYDEDYLVAAASVALEAAATNSDAPAILRALDADDVTLRLISIRAASRLVPSQAKPLLAQRLKDRDERVRLGAARALATMKERAGVLEALVALLESPDLTIRTRAQQTLQSVTGQAISFASQSSAADRAESIRAWRQWIATHGASIKLGLPLTDRIPGLARTLVVSPSLLVELDSDHKERSRIALSGGAGNCQGLSNGNRLIAMNAHSMVVEYDEAGKEVWRKDRLPAPPTTVQRLDDGATLAASPSINQLIEIGTDGSISTIAVPGGPVSAQRLDSGNTLVALQDAHRIAEITLSGHTVWEMRTDGPPSHAVRLDNGNTLVTLPQLRKVAEYDSTGSTPVWMSHVPLINPTVAQRLPNGNTLVGDHTGVMELDPTGEQILWRYRQPQVTGLSAY